jgi:SAM-dependent methyltransferase
MSQPLYFDFNHLFDPEEYLYFMEESLREEDTLAQISFLEKQLALAPGMKIVDLGCGHGRHVIEFARKGYDCVGVDLVEGFLEIGRQNAERAGVRATFVRGDMGSFGSEYEFDRATCLFDAFGFFDDAHAINTLLCVHKALSEGGLFALDLRTREWMTRIPMAAVLDKGNGDMMIDRHHFDITTGRFVDRRTYLRAGKQREVMFSVRLYAFTEIRLILQSVGFEVVGAFGGFEDTPISPQRPRTVVIAKKVAPTAANAPPQAGVR